MKKLLNISVIAALAVLPLAANAAVTDAVPGPTVTGDTATAATATTAPKYGLAAAESNDGNVATAGYVKGAYNAAIKAINRVSETAANALTADGEATLTNKAIDANGTGNSITNIEKDNFAAGAVVDSTTGIAAVGSASDDKFVTEKAVASEIADATDGMVTETKTQTLTNKTISGGTVSGATITGGTIDADSTTISNLEADNFKAGTVSTSVRASTSAEDTKLVTEKAVATAIEGAITDLGMDNYATQDGVETTVTNALDSVTVKYDLSGLGVSTGAVTGTANAAITVMDTWGSNTAASQTISAPVDLTSTVAVTGLTGNSSNQSATVTHGTVQYTEPANP